MMASILKPTRRSVWKKTILLVIALLSVLLSVAPASGALAYNPVQHAQNLVAQCYPVTSCGTAPTPPPSSCYPASTCGTTPTPAPTTPTPAPAPAAAVTPDCSTSSALSWVLCPLTQLIVGATNIIETTLIVPYLTVSPLTTEATNPVFELWSKTLILANIMFIGSFFFVIFSQATSIGLSNYGVKRMLPRFVWVAILANLSYYLVAFAIDAFNIFGAGVAQLVMGILTTGNTAGGGQATAVNSFTQIAVPAAVVGVGLAMNWLLPLLGAIFLIILIAVVVLVVRQMLILLLVVLSPLLAVAELLPNTEKYADKGWNMLFKLLLMYPLIILIFAIGNIVGALLSSGDIQLANGQAASKEVSDVIKQVFVALAKAAPLLLIPATFAAAEEMLGNAHKLVQRHSQTLTDRGKQAYQNSSYGKYQQLQRDQRQQDVAAGNYVAKSKWSKYTPGHYVNMTRSRLNRSTNKSPFMNNLTGGFGAQQTLQDGTQRKKERTATQAYFNDDYDLAEAWLKTGGDMSKPEFKALSVPRQNTFRQMANSRLNRSGDSFVAAMELVANSGRGDQAMATATFKKIRELDPASGENDVATLANNMRVAYRKTGRGDLAGTYNTTTLTSSPENFTSMNLPDNTKPPVSAWADVSFENLTRHVLEKPIKPSLPGEEVRMETLEKYLARSATNAPERMRKIVEALPKMEPRARERAEEMIHRMYQGQPTLTGVTFPPVPGATTARTIYAGDKASLLAELRQELKLVPK